MSGLEEVVKGIRAGRVVGIPTDTVYGLAVDPWNRAAVTALYVIKGRPDDKPIGLLAASLEQAEEVVDLGSARRLAVRHWPGALTLVVRPRVVIPDWLGDRALRTLGIRVPDHEPLRRILATTGALAVTSANRSGGEETRDEAEARRELGDDVALYLPGNCPGQMPSTVVDATVDPYSILRLGPVLIGGER